MNYLKPTILILFLSLVIGQINTSLANVKPAKIFSSNMVLQKGIENTIWGWADKNEKVSISLNGKTVKAKPGKDGKWTAKLPVMDYGGPYTLTIKGKNTIEMTNVMIGEVWICSGQSNMEFPVSGTKNAAEEIENANYPNIRFFTVPKKVSKLPVADIETGEWSVCTPKTVPGFSAVGYFFGRKINKDLNVTVGLIHTSWGGTDAETWISSETIKNDPDLSGRWNDLQKADLANYEASIKEKVKTLLGEFPTKDNGVQQGFTQSGFDDSAWKTIKAPTLWEEQGYVGIDGIGWYRKSFVLNKEQASSELLLSLAKIDDNDISWVNGVEVGKTMEYNADRKYKVPASALKEGNNVIAIRVTDTGGGGGIYGNAEDLFALAGKTKISLAGDWKIKFTEISTNIAIGPNEYPTLLFNGMINPVVPYGIKGVIWYQGENNASRAKQYRRIFPSLITDWRNKWQLGNFPFIWVQLANFMAPVDQPAESSWAELREAQAMTLKLPNTGMASAIDIGDATNIHPTNKQEVGKRLALNALKITYGKDVVYTGPTYESMKVDGKNVIVKFSSTGSGLKVNNKYGYINGFAIAGADKKFHWAKAVVISDNSVVLHSEEVPLPVAVRYGWADNPDDLNLYNKEGLPANPFRTDDWPGITK
ncbi:MAG TPA: sialate O-acetylesterase [Prolixibacteraceae bacterium]